MSCSVADVSLKNSDETFKFSSEILNFSEEKFYETVTETSVLHPPVNSTQRVFILETSSHEHDFPPVEHSNDFLESSSNASHPLTYDLETKDNETEILVSLSSARSKVSEVKKGSSPSSRPELKSEDLGSMETRKGSYLREDQGLETKDSKQDDHLAILFEDNSEDYDSFLKGTILKVLEQNQADMSDSKDFKDFMDGLQDFLTEEDALQLLHDPEIIIRLNELKRLSSLKDLHEDVYEEDMLDPLAEEFVSYRSTEEVIVLEDCQDMHASSGKELANDDSDEAYLSVDSSLLEDDIYLIEEKDISLPEPTFELFHPHQYGTEQKYGLYRLNPRQMDRLFIQLCDEATALLEDEQLRLVAFIQEDFNTCREAKDYEKVSHQLQSLMELLQGLTNLDRWIRRVLDGDFG